MKRYANRFLASLILTVAWLATGSTARAVAPMPYPPSELRQVHRGVETVPVLPEWAFADLGSFPSSDLGVGYFASSVQPTETSAIKEEHALRDAKEKKAKKAKKAKKPKKFRGGTPSDDGPGDWPVLTEPRGHAYGKSGGTPPAGGEVPESSSSALFAIAMVGLLMTLRSRRPRQG